jgi:hypothetical protein
MPEKEQTVEEIIKECKEISTARGYREANEFVMAVLFGPEKRKPRKRKEAVLTGAEKQKRFRERRKAEGRRRIESWADDEKPEQAYKTVKVNVHRDSIGLCKRERHLNKYLAACLKLAEEGSAQGYFPEEICSDLYEFYKALGYEKPPETQGREAPAP